MLDTGVRKYGPKSISPEKLADYYLRAGATKTALKIAMTLRYPSKFCTKMAKANDIDSAVKLAEHLVQTSGPFRSKRKQLLSSIINHAPVESYKQAMQVAEANQVNSAQCYSIMASKLLRKGRRAEAISLLRKALRAKPEDEKQLSVRPGLTREPFGGEGEIAVQLAQAGATDEAIAALKKMKDTKEREAATTELLPWLLQDGAVKESIELAEKLSDPEEQAYAFRSISGEFASKKDVQRALEFAARIRDKEMRVLHMDKMLENLIENNALASAVVMAERVEDPQRRSFGLIFIAIELLMEKDDEGGYEQKMKQKFSAADQKVAESIIQARAKRP